MNICDSIKKRYIRLSKGQRKVAQFVVDNPNIIASQIASEVGRLAGVSESTVIRFCYAMDLSGFSELQDKMKAYLIESGEMPIIKQRAPRKKQAQLGEMPIAKAIADVTTSIAAIDEALFDKVVQSIHASQSIYIIGFRQAVPAALWLFNELTSQRDRVYFIEHEAEDIARNLAAMDEQSLLLTFMFDEKFEDIETVMTIAQRKNIEIFALCSQPHEAKQQSITYLPIEGLGAQRKIATFSLLYALIECVAKQNKTTQKKGVII